MAEQREHGSDEKMTNTAMEIGLAFFVAIVIVGAVGISTEQILSSYGGILGYFRSQEFRDLLFYPMLIFILLDLILIGFLSYLLIKYQEIYSSPMVLPPEKQPDIHPVSLQTEAAESWGRIRELANSGNPSDWNMAILRADAVLDDMLKHRGYEGETMADRLKIADPFILKSLDRVWSAHRLRNSIAHEPTIEHPKETIINAMRAYQDALKELGVIE